MEEEQMSQKNPSPHFANIVVLGAVWGFAEAGLGLGLQRCASLASGSIMPGGALLFIARGWVLAPPGAGGVLLVLNLFPLVRFATGIPACVYPGTGYPLSLYYAPIAVGLSFLTVPLGFWIGEQIAVTEGVHESFVRGIAVRSL